MKYIRTKDERIIDTEKEYINHPSNYPIQARDYGLVINQADTIEELCDAYVVKSGEAYIVWQILSFDQIRLNYKSKVYEIYGAIWTDKGLIYVAKMNEKGELVLI